MAFETGLASNEFELQEKLNAFILSIDGWSKVTQAGNFDSVYFSNGSDGYKDIYIRSVAGLVENPSFYGGNQRDFGDGYVGFLNFFAYQFYPEGGDGYDGYGEAGRLGPMWVHARDPSTRDLWMQAFSYQGSGSANNRRWVFLGDITRQEDGNSLEFPSSPFASIGVAFDGKRKMYFTTSSSTLSEWDFATGRARMIDRRVETADTDVFCRVYYVDRKTRQEYLWDGIQFFTGDFRSGSYDTISPVGTASSWRRWVINPVQGQGYMQSGFSGPIWPPVGDGHGASAGHGIWDGHDNIYVLRGEAPSEYLVTGGETSDWAKYHIPTDKWTIFTSASAPLGRIGVDYRTPALPVTVSSADNTHFVWLDKKTTGYDYHRIYVVLTGDQDIYYINIDENSGMPVGSWTSQGNMPASPGTAHWLLHNDRDRFYWRRGASERTMYTADFRESGNLSWSLVDTDYFPGSTGSLGGTDFYVDGYASRVRTSLYDSTEYWFFGDQNHITVATKADDIYTFCYMGAITPYTNTFPAARCTNEVFPGSNVEINITDLKGEFVIGQRMYIADVTDGGGGSFTGDVEGVERKFMPIEKFTITDVDPGVSITADTLTQRYRPGSRVSFDPQPVGITLGGLDKIQMLNSINTTTNHGAIESAFNIAKLETVRDEVVNSSGGDDRRDLYALWPITILNSQDDDTNLVGTEARGSLIGIFAVSGTGDLESGSTISVGPNTYIVLEVDSGKTFKYAFGPLS